MKKIDKKEIKTSGEIKQYNLWQQRIKNMLKKKASEMIQTAIENGYNHIVLEDLSVFGKSYIRGENFHGFKYSRLTKLLNLSNLKNIVTSICEKKGVQLTLIHPHYTSKACSKCGHIDTENRKSQEQFKCVECGFTINADANSSINIRDFGKQEVLSNSPLLKRNHSSGWFSSANLNKFKIRELLENIIMEIRVVQPTI